MSVIELKALVYDRLQSLQQIQGEIDVLSREIGNRTNQEATSEVKKDKNKK